MSTKTTTTRRADLLRRAVTLTAECDLAMLDEIFGQDLTVWSPGRVLMSRSELADELRLRDQAFSDFSVEIMFLDVIGNRGYAEWAATGDHTADLVVDDLVVEATGTPVSVHGVTVANFDGDHIIALRQYWDELAMLTDLGLVPPE
jgi:ketosteroid isomerase-like protein